MVKTKLPDNSQLEQCPINCAHTIFPQFAAADEVLLGATGRAGGLSGMNLP
jgi:hypothetical protein